VNLKFSFSVVLFALLAVGFTSCGDDDADLESKSYNYAFHTGQTVAAAPYSGDHADNFAAELVLQEMENGNTMITVNLSNTVDGETYRIHAHDAEDAASTPNGTPYNETPNADVLATSVEGNGGTASVSEESTMSVTELSTTYSGFFVVHDPLQDISTVDISTYLVVGSFAR